MSDHRKPADPKPPVPITEGEISAEPGPSDVQDRRAFLVSLGRYSAAVVSLVGGGVAVRALSGCGLLEETCSDDCAYAFDGICADGGNGSTYDLCEHGTDCDDCGPRGEDYEDEYSGSYSEYSNYYSEYSNYSNYSNYYNYYNYYSNYSNYYNYSA